MQQDKIKFGLLKKYMSIGLSLLPVSLSSDGAVVPMIKGWQLESKINDTNIENYVDANAWGIVTGKLSNNLEVIDFDEKHRKGIYKEFLKLLPQESRDLLGRLPLSKSKSGGYHILYRCSVIGGNQKLAQFKNEQYITEVMIETRGEGGFIFEYPTPKYEFINKLSLLKEITPKQRQILLDTARSLDEMPTVTIDTGKNLPIAQEENIFTEFNSKHTWEEILTPLGWSVSGKRGDEVFWTRPGKSDKSVSATENYKGLGLFHVFTTSSDIPDGKSYNKFQIYAHENHGGDYKKAVKELRDKGYGKKFEIKNVTNEIPVGDGFQFQKATDVVCKPIEWLWKGKIAKGKVTLIAGDPGLGKSQVSIDIASTLSTGGVFPGGSISPVGKTLFFSAEDDPADTIVPRLKACGANLDLIHIFTCIKKQGKEQYFSLEEDMDGLDKYLAVNTGISLIVIDPVTAFLGKNTDSHKNSDVRALLHRISTVAGKYQIAVVVVTHLNKSTGTNAMSKISGSLAFIAAARAGFMVMKDKDDESKRLFMPVKNNIANDNGGFSFRVKSFVLDGGIETSHVVWDKEPVTKTLSELMASADDKTGVDAKHVEWLEAFVRKYGDDGVARQVVEKAAIAYGISGRQLVRAKKAAMIDTISLGVGKGVKYVCVDFSDTIDAEDVPL